MGSKFQIMISSDSNYEKLVAEVYFKDDLVAQIIQDEGIEKAKIKFFQNDYQFDLKEFNEATQHAINKLNEK